MDPISLHLAGKKGVKLIHARPCNVPRSIEQQLCTKKVRMVDTGVLEDYSSGWKSLTFAIDKKNGAIRVLSDFRKLNSWFVWI